MPTFKAIVLKHQIKTDKTVNIKIRVIHNRKTRYISTGLTGTTSDFTKSLKFKTQSFIDDTTETIKSYRDKCNKYPDKVNAMSIDDLITFITEEEPVLAEINFISFANTEIERLKAEGRRGVAANHNTAINTLKRFIGGEDLNVQNITAKFLQDFEVFIRSKPIGENNKDMVRAPSLYMSSIRALHNELKKQYNNEDIGIIRVPYSPFSKYKIPVEKQTRKRALDIELIKKIFELQDQTAKTDRSHVRYNLAKDCFILSFCLLGINSADLYNCSEFKNKFITYKRKKTSSRRKDEAEISVLVQKEIDSLMLKYRDKTGKRVFNFYQHYSNEQNFNKAINKGLKLVGKTIKTDDLEYYAARHSWATIALNKAGIDKYTVHSALNHVDDAMKVTDIYLEKDWSLINDANRKVLDFVFKKKENPETVDGTGVKAKRKQKKLTEPIPEIQKAS
jgi:integrase